MEPTAGMYERLERSGGQVLGYEVTDRVTEAELQAMIREMETVIDQQGSVSLLVYVRSFPSFELRALDDDLGFWFDHRRDLDRYAVVGDSRLIRWASELSDRFTRVQIRYFDETEIDDAWAWVEREQ